MKEEFFDFIRNSCIESMTYEVMAAPKPGLVDRFNSGAHKDMDIFTFIDSIMSLRNYFYDITKLGFEFNKEDYRLLMEGIRPLGIEAEKSMFKASNGVNTHKGLIFLMGILAAGAGNLYGRSMDISPENISLVTKKMTRGISEELQKPGQVDKLTYGERIFKEYNILGIRGEVEEGLPTVINVSLPVYTKLMEDPKITHNAAMVHTLLHLISLVDDINILGRHGMDTLDYVRKRAKQALQFGGYLTTKGKNYVKYMDMDFIDRHISPGGAADLLAVTILLYLLREEVRFNGKKK